MTVDTRKAKVVRHIANFVMSRFESIKPAETEKLRKRQPGRKSINVTTPKQPEQKGRT